MESQVAGWQDEPGMIRSGGAVMLANTDARERCCAAFNAIEYPCVAQSAGALAQSKTASRHWVNSLWESPIPHADNACGLNLFRSLPFYSSKQMERIIRIQSGGGLGIANRELLLESFVHQAAHHGQAVPAASCNHWS